jgi:hypothetical protein
MLVTRDDFYCNVQRSFWYRAIKICKHVSISILICLYLGMLGMLLIIEGKIYS